MLAPLDQEKIALSRFSDSCVSVFGTANQPNLQNSGWNMKIAGN
jgi:hypothetical protein